MILVLSFITVTPVAADSGLEASDDALVSEDAIPVELTDDATQQLGLAAGQLLGRTPVPGDEVVIPSKQLRILVRFGEAGDAPTGADLVDPGDEISYPQWRVTLGTAVYVYATGSDLLYVAGLGWTAATVYICGPAAAAGAAAAIGCSIVAYAIWHWAQSNSVRSPSECFEFRFRVVHTSTKRVPSSLC